MTKHPPVYLVGFFLLSFLICGCIYAPTTYKYTYRFEKALESSVELVDDTIIYCSSNVDGVFRLKSYNHSLKEVHSISNDRNVACPFYYGRTLHYLIEDSLPDFFKVYPGIAISEKQYFKKALSSDNGKYVLLADVNNAVYIIQYGSDSLIKIMESTGEIVGMAVSESALACVVCIDDDVFLIDLKNYTKRKIFKNIPGRKLNPKFSGSNLLICSYGDRDRYGIYSCAITRAEEDTPTAIIHTSYDLRLPQIDSMMLYYIEIVNSEYLLRRRNLMTNTVEDLTTSGVVYNYFITSESIIYTYSDVVTPKSVKVISKRSGRSGFLAGSRIDVRLRVDSIQRNNCSPAFRLMSRDYKKPTGVILYFHPGVIGGDFSPRWDNMIYPLCENGLMVIAPNYPGSSGYGKNYGSLPLNAAVIDMEKWMAVIQREYSGLPIYFYSLSSGTMLMERCLRLHNKNVAGAISAFGVSDLEVPPYVPLLYVLGNRDPIVNYEERIATLENSKVEHPDITIVTLQNEKHWIQYPGNYYHYFDTMLHFINANR